MAELSLPRFRGRRRAWPALLLLVVVAYCAFCGWFWVRQRDFLYAPGGTLATPAAVGLPDFSVVRIDTADNEHVVGWWKPPPKPGAGVILYLRGTPGTVADYAPYVMPDIVAAGLGALAIDYRGFGGSTGSPSEAGIRSDSEAAYDFIRREAPQSKIVVYGQSFGTGPAVTLAANRPVAGVLLNAPYASVLRLFEIGAPPLLPYRWLLIDQYNSETTIRRVMAPVLILRGSADATIPAAEAYRLYEAANPPKRLIEVAGAGHTEAWQGEAKSAGLSAFTAWTR